MKKSKIKEKSMEDTKNLEKDILDAEFEKEFVQDILNDFRNRQLERKNFESVWQLCINFFLGNQYCSINGRGDVVDNPKQYFWEERQVFNHIAPIIELRLSKLNRVRPTLTVVPFSDDEEDINCAKVSKKILNAVSYDNNISNLLSQGTVWSEICGTSFYKVVWNPKGGKIVAKDCDGVNIHEGEVELGVVSPFEIYPDSNTYSNVEDCMSIIHARAFHIDTVKNIWGVDVEGKDIDVFSLETIPTSGSLNSSILSKKVKKNHIVVIEKYEMPTVAYPEGRLIIIAGDKLVYIGELPYINMAEEERGFPFIRQMSITTPNCFWGTSVIERCIPIQRAYNAIKNRKHEFLNRISMGVLAVEDGSVDMENLEEEGLSPGKVLVYRHGSTSPRMISTGSVPLDFQYEENQLLNEFLNISGVSDLINSRSMTSNLSGIALQLLIEQDEVRLLSSAEQIRYCAKEISKHILRLYKQYAKFPHTTKLIGKNGGVEMFYWKNTDITSDDVVFETDSEMNETLAQKRSMIFEILSSGLLHDEDGKLTNSMRRKILEQLGFGYWENSKDVKSLQVNNAEKENLSLLLEGKLESPKEIDDHECHINEHICFMLGNDFGVGVKKNKSLEKRLLEHIKQHKLFETMKEKAEVINASNIQNATL